MKAATMESKVEGAVMENVAEPIRKVMRTAAKSVDGLAAETKQAAARVEKGMKKNSSR